MPAPSTIWNPFRGCRKEFAGCEHCWMFHLAEKHGIDPMEITKSKSVWDLPFRKGRNGEYMVQSGEILNVCLTGDFFLEDVPNEWRNDVWKMIRRRSDVGFVILTKRAYRISDCLPEDWRDGYPNVILAVTVENQQAADDRIPYLIDVLAQKKRIMCEPLLEKLDLRTYFHTGEIDEVLCGGENYPGARRCNLSWVENLSEQCADAGVGFHFFDTGSNFSDGVSECRITDADERHQRANEYNLDVCPNDKRELVLKKHPLDDLFAGDTLF